MGVAIPITEVAHHAYPLGVGGPDRKRHPHDVSQTTWMGAEYTPQFFVGAFCKEVEVELAQE
jgi:hypothetical protein